ncbi:MAG: DUF4139 domain-containing protein [Candidatus Eisenbacteria bacterium]|uniref:DUF4139 domain-containing protein n=1 Tax=Eiseniibacteriota bacterium TaxID=2212470 RepID=A0A9D6L4R7_UNCEI|nr:DUF4139 domain-containing protein [Candidatus Eisenbacteria bacterium]MBI3538828.1 DUF4139 domain-containing protein [Candidatus Eisenbacteria bacterium]
MPSARLATIRTPVALAVALLAAPAVAGLAVAGAAVTVYTHDLAYVRETRTLDLAGARDTVRISDLPERLDVTSVRLVPAGGARVAGLAYRFDVANGDALLDRGRGGRVRVVMRGARTIEGTLIGSDGTWLIVRTDDGAVRSLARGAAEDVEFANPPRDMSLRPTLEAVVEGGRGRTNAELSYLTAGLSWSAEHALVRSSGTGGTWSSAVTVENTTGRDFADASLKLVAGEPNRAGGVPRPVFAMRTATLAGAEERTDLDERTFGEYHLYTLDRPATLRHDESRALTMVAPRAVKLAPRYLYRGGGTAVTSQLVLENTSGSGLGVPLPAGRVRIYEPDPAGAVQFIGEARIGHTAEGETLTLDVGTAFDIAAERRLVSEKRLNDREHESTIEIRLRNHKAAAVTVTVEESVAADHTVLSSTAPATAKDATTLQFALTAAAGKETVLTYTVRARY